MSINSTQLLAAYEATRNLSRNDDSVTERFHPIEEIFEDKKRAPDAVVMVYGVYNAGKSTLINALLGDEAAATDDIPLTDSISAYRWGQYNILNTPGVDAPIKHENVTRGQMLKADAIIFVVDPVGTAEEAKTLSVLMDLQQAGKQVLLVFNEKKPINEEDFIKLKDQTRERLQQMASVRGLHDILKSIPIVRVNAKRALQGKLKGQPKLIELSGYPALEKQLSQFLQSISPDDIYGRLKCQLIGFLTEYIEILNDRSKSKIVKQYDVLLSGISVEKSRLRQEMGRELLRHKSSIYEKSKSVIRSEPESCQVQIEKLLKNAGEDISARLNDELQIFINGIEKEIEQLQVALPSISQEGVTVTTPVLETAAGASQGRFTEASNLDPTLVKGAVDQIAALARPEHIVSSLKVVKSVLPALMKGIGVKTMQKWAETALTKWIPYVGTFVSAASVLINILSGDSEEKQLRQQTEEQQRVKERAIQQMEDFAREISDSFEKSMRDIIQNELDTFFANVAAQVNLLRQGFSESEYKNSQHLERLLEIQQLAANA